MTQQNTAQNRDGRRAHNGTYALVSAEARNGTEQVPIARFDVSLRLRCCWLTGSDAADVSGSAGPLCCLLVL